MAAGRRLRSDLLYLADGVASGSLNVRRFTRATRGVIFREYFIVYSLGAISVYPFYTLTDRDITILNEELASETGFLREFGRDLSTGHLVLDPIARARLYLLALRGIFERGRLEAMPAGPYRWRLGITEHCSQCVFASQAGPYQRDRFSGLGLPTIPGAPGDGSVCQGLTRCGCTVELDTGVPVPNANIAERLRGLLLEVMREPSRDASRAGTE